MNRNDFLGRDALKSQTAHALATLDTTQLRRLRQQALPALALGTLIALSLPAQAQEATPANASGNPSLKVATLAESMSRPVVERGRLSLREFAAKQRRLRLASLSEQDAPAPAPQPAPEAEAPAPGSVTLSGLLDFYYGINPRSPRAAGGGAFTGITAPNGETIKADNFARFFDIRERELSFALGEVNINRTAGKGFPFGLTATLTFGDSARLFHATEPGGTSSYYPFHNLFLTHNTKLFGKDVAVDFGKWASPFGTEVLESNLNDNYSRAFTYWYGVPFYHLGARMTMPLNSKLTLQAALTNGWNNVADDNNAKTLYAQLTYKPNDKFTQILGWIGGLEGTGGLGTISPTAGGGGVTLNVLDLQSIYQVNSKLKLGGWVVYGNAAGSIQGVGALTGRADDRFSGNWLGLVGYVKYQATPKFSAAVRLEQFEDIPGLGGLSPRFQLPGYMNMKGYTLTFEYAANPRLVTRFEYRHDISNQSVFGAGAGGTTTDQDTLTIGQVFRF